MSNKEYSVNWKNHTNHVRNAFSNLLTVSELTDVTLYCEGRKIGAHKMLLSVCSDYFRDTFKEVPCPHPVIILHGVEYSVLKDILHFIYNGEVSVDTSMLDKFLKVAQMLKISGLRDVPSKQEEESLELANCSQDSDDTFVENLSPVSSEEPKRAPKRSRNSDPEPQEKIQKLEQEEHILISDVKCEPPSLVDFEDPLQDPLGGHGTSEFLTEGGQPEEEFKRTMESLEIMKKRFNDQMNDSKLKKGKNNQLFSREEYYSFIRKIKETKTKITGKTPSEYRRLSKYDILKIGSVERLIVPIKNEQEPIIYFTFLEENFRVIHEIHIAMGHAGRDRMMKEIKSKYRNITIELVSIYLNLCEPCKKKPNASKKGHSEQSLSQE